MNQVGTDLEPNGRSLCMEELGDGFSFVFLGFGVFGWMLGVEVALSRATRGRVVVDNKPQ